ncbi:hypothetical protein [Dorea sp. AM13-35]|uniref:hypothetical protein n=1 Tax=Dorea sp. AM13-35 TaxID=2293099 RepID=UPI000E4C889B|nr:hypothetical protein [Dorea sp. AM13-35]RHO38522.1 hypothetical protein DW152_11405 [Dorea sp. AM13-35]
MRKNREYKSDVFSMLMESKENALEDWLKDNDKDLFSRRQIQIPTPHFIVFYNGMQKKPEYEEMRLSDSFYHKAQEPQIEIICKVYNINPENNQKLKKKSTVLEGYTYFVEKVRENQRQQMNLEEAVDSAIHDCIDHHILEDFFRRRKEEVKKMTHLDYTWEKRERLIRMEEYADGEAAGIQKGKAAGLREGKAVGIRDSLLELLQEFGDIPEALQTRIESEKDLQVLTSWLKVAARADSLEEFQEKTGLL